MTKIITITIIIVVVIIIIIISSSGSSVYSLTYLKVSVYTYSHIRHASALLRGQCNTILIIASVISIIINITIMIHVHPTASKNALNVQLNNASK